MSIPKTVTYLSIQLSKTHQGYSIEIYFHNVCVCLYCMLVCLYILAIGITLVLLVLHPHLLLLYKNNVMNRNIFGRLWLIINLHFSNVQ